MGGSGFTYDYFISRRGTVAALAQEAADVLEAAGYRGELLAALHAALAAPDGRAALTQAAVHGLGGVGKTSLARAYVARHEDAYEIIWWMGAADRAGTLAGLADLAHALGGGIGDGSPDRLSVGGSKFLTQS